MIILTQGLIIKFPASKEILKVLEHMDDAVAAATKGGCFDPDDSGREFTNLPQSTHSLAKKIMTLVPVNKHLGKYFAAQQEHFCGLPSALVTGAGAIDQDWHMDSSSDVSLRHLPNTAWSVFLLTEDIHLNGWGATEVMRDNGSRLHCVGSRGDVWMFDVLCRHRGTCNSTGSAITKVTWSYGNVRDGEWMVHEDI